MFTPLKMIYTLAYSNLIALNLRIAKEVFLKCDRHICKKDAAFATSF